VQGCLSGSPLFGIGSFAIETIFYNVQIKGTEINTAEIIQRMIHDMKFEILIGLPTPGKQLLRPVQDPTIQLLKVLRCKCIFVRLKIVEVTD
jgi:hypothetical protein